MAQNKLTRTRALVAARNKELEGLVREGGTSNGAFVFLSCGCAHCAQLTRGLSRECVTLSAGTLTLLLPPF
jgi:hypothetical protein